MASHPDTGLTYLYGGTNEEGTRLSDMFVWDGDAWSEVDQRLPEDTNHQLVYLPGEESFAVFSSSSETGDFLWDGEQVSDLMSYCNYGCPSTIEGAVYHRGLGAPMVLGWGYQGGDLDVWYLGEDQYWHSVEGGPSDRSESAVGYDPVRDEVWLFGGRSGTHTRRNDLWRFDGEWTLVQDFDPSVDGFPGDTRPGGRQGATFTWHPGIEKMVLLGGYGDASGIWAWDGSTWERLESEQDELYRFSHATVYDEFTGKLLVMGGTSGSAYPGSTMLVAIEEAAAD